MDEDLLIPPMENLLIESEDNSTDSMDDDDPSSPDSDEELIILAATEAELIHGVEGSYMLAKKGWSLQLAVSFDILVKFCDEYEQLIAAGRISHMRATNLEVISNAPHELVVYAKSLKMQDSYPLKKYSCDELAYLDKTGELEMHPLAKEKGWCLISVDGFDNLFGTSDLIPDL